MAGFTLGEKSDSTQMFDENGQRIPVTFLKTTPCYLIDIHMPESHGYMAVKLGFGTPKSKNVKKSFQGQFKKAGISAPLRYLREIRVRQILTPIEEEKKRGLQIDEAKLFIGDQVKPELIFKKGDMVDVSGTSKGKGFQGVVKRHHFAGGPKTHGQSDRWRAPGSIGQGTTPGRVYKGKKMAGRMGGDRVTVRNLRIFEVNDEGIFVTGLVPGHKNSLIEIKSA